MKKLILILAMATASQAFAALGNLSPLGQYGNPNDRWQQPWSEAFFKCAEQSEEAKALFAKISEGKVEDLGSGKKFCSSENLSMPANAKLALLTTLKVLAKHESGYNPQAENPNSPNPPAVGLFQIGPTDITNHKCTKPDGSGMSGVADLKVPENNICCAVKIAGDQAKDGGKGKAPNKFAEGKEGIMADFWEPMRTAAANGTKGAKGEELVKEINQHCAGLGGQGGSSTGAITAQETSLSQQDGGMR